MNVTDEIWNRAAMHDGGSQARAGDLALAAVIGTHGLIMNGGLLDAVERTAPEQVDAAEAGYRWFQLDAAAAVIVLVRRELSSGPLDDDAVDALETRVSADYAEAIPTDQTIVDAFESRFRAEPQAFGPV